MNKVKMKKHILNFEKMDRRSLPLVGGKNASLGEMIKAGIRVPPGFAVTTKSYETFLARTGIKNKIFNILSGLNPDNIEELDNAATEVQNLIKKGALSSQFKNKVEKAYNSLCMKCEVNEIPVAVRSSATAEDLPDASFAGQQDTYLWVIGIEKILESIQKCWASLFTPRAISYRIKNKFSRNKVLISVGIQEMVNSKAAGVMFTLNPTNGDPSKILIEGSWGLGEAVVSGFVNPDKFVLDKVTMELNEKVISVKEVECVFDNARQGVCQKAIAPEQQYQCCLKRQEIDELAKIGRGIEAHYGCPMDIEWAVSKDLSFPKNIFILQARPETVWSQRNESKIGKKTGNQLLLDTAMNRIKLI